MDAIRASPSWSNAMTDFDPMVKIELEAAEVVAGLAHFPANMSKSRGNDSVAERVKDECINVNSLFDTFPKCSINLYEVCY